eukprot:284816480_4
MPLSEDREFSPPPGDPQRGLSPSSTWLTLVQLEPPSLSHRNLARESGKGHFSFLCAYVPVIHVLPLSLYLGVRQPLSTPTPRREVPFQVLFGTSLLSRANGDESLPLREPEKGKRTINPVLPFAHVYNTPRFSAKFGLLMCTQGPHRQLSMHMSLCLLKFPFPEDPFLSPNVALASAHTMHSLRDGTFRDPPGPPPPTKLDSARSQCTLMPTPPVFKKWPGLKLMAVWVSFDH